MPRLKMSTNIHSTLLCTLIRSTLVHILNMSNKNFKSQFCVEEVELTARRQETKEPLKGRVKSQTIHYRASSSSSAIAATTVTT